MVDWTFKCQTVGEEDEHPFPPQRLCKEALVLRPCLCTADSTGPSHTALDRLSRATHTCKKCTHPGPQAGSRTIFILAYKAGQQSSVFCFVHVCVCLCVCVYLFLRCVNVDLL